jgi:mannose/fructose/N-acetylgalactosamine-specific phosphotransferase system component IIC
VTEETDVDGSARARPRGWVSLYFVAFALMLAAGAALASSAVNFLDSTRPLWLSTGLSAAAILAAIAAVVLPRRR